MLTYFVVFISKSFKNFKDNVRIYNVNNKNFLSNWHVKYNLYWRKITWVPDLSKCKDILIIKGSRIYRKHGKIAFSILSRRRWFEVSHSFKSNISQHFIVQLVWAISNKLFEFLDRAILIGTEVRDSKIIFPNTQFRKIIWPKILVQMRYFYTLFQCNQSLWWDSKESILLKLTSHLYHYDLENYSLLTVVH